MGSISCHSNQSSYPIEIKTQIVVLPTCRCYMRNMKRFRLAASEEKSFENVDDDGRRTTTTTDDARTPARRKTRTQDNSDPWYFSDPRRVGPKPETTRTQF